ncbi:hypothetical protein EDC30_106131 [Paucimonas lemoignei]|uniref:Uncharacterized protein n=1 Tax=Paucimonas lemoignei TaxID=29443 RepID=A0A4R3HYM7_PAULE|nr:hypothetical protein EDC30_106131 [Paucimonas lemoignei]
MRPGWDWSRDRRLDRDWNRIRARRPAESQLRLTGPCSFQLAASLVWVAVESLPPAGLPLEGSDSPEAEKPALRQRPAIAGR